MIEAGWLAGRLTGWLGGHLMAGLAGLHSWLAGARLAGIDFKHFHSCPLALAWDYFFNFFPELRHIPELIGHCHMLFAFDRFLSELIGLNGFASRIYEDLCKNKPTCLLPS